MSLKYEQIIELVSKGIGPTKYDGALKGASYLGNPGKDIYFWLQTDPSEEETKDVAKLLSKSFPKKPPHNPIEYGACVRYIYGMFEKQGVLRSKDDKKRMIEDQQSWNESEIFITFLNEELSKNKNYFGLALLSEQIAHRLGDKAVMKNDDSFLIEMENQYRLAFKYASSCNSKKHLMTTYYWAGRYFAEMSKKDKAIQFYRKAVKAADQHCPDARRSLRDKIVDELRYLKKHDPDFSSFYSYWKKNAKHKAVKAAIKMIRS